MGEDLTHAQHPVQPRGGLLQAEKGTRAGPGWWGCPGPGGRGAGGLSAIPPQAQLREH